MYPSPPLRVSIEESAWKVLSMAALRDRPQTCQSAYRLPLLSAGQRGTTFTPLRVLTNCLESKSKNQTTKENFELALAYTKESHHGHGKCVCIMCVLKESL